MPAEKLIFIDETGAATNMARPRGRAPRGERLVVAVPHGHWRSTTLVAAPDLRGVRCGNVFDGPLDGACFEAFVGRTLLPTLGAGDVVIADNLSGHKGRRVRELVESAGARPLFLPPQGPDFNPIGNAFSKVKGALRSAAARTVDALWGSVQPALDLVAAGDAAGYFGHCGYPLDPG